MYTFFSSFNMPGLVESSTPQLINIFTGYPGSLRMHTNKHNLQEWRHVKHMATTGKVAYSLCVIWNTVQTHDLRITQYPGTCHLSRGALSLLPNPQCNVSTRGPDKFPFVYILGISTVQQYTVQQYNQTTDHLIFRCKELHNQRTEFIKEIKNNGGDWPI